MQFHTEYLTFRTAKHREYVNITSQVETALRKSGIQEGMILVSAMHITAGVWVNDAEDGLIADIDEWLEKLAPFRAELPASPHRRNQRRFALEEPAGAPPGDRAGDQGQAGFRPLAAGLLRRVRRPALQARHHQGDGRVKRKERRAGGI